MPDKHKKFHEFALKSILFKGRHDWYFCFLKSERIAHVFMLLARTSPGNVLEDLAHIAAQLPGTVARLAAGELDAEAALADVFDLLAGTRLAATNEALSQENAPVLCREYEQLAEKLVEGSHPSPSGTEEFAISLPGEPERLPALSDTIKDEPFHKGHKGQYKGQKDRMSLILDFIKKQKSPSIKDIMSIVKDCSEKTIQRELGILIEQGLVKRVGERRWSHYEPA